MKGAPLRFLALTLGGWAIGRAAVLWPEVGAPPVVARLVAPRAAAAVPYRRGFEPPAAGTTAPDVADRASIRPAPIAAAVAIPAAAQPIDGAPPIPPTPEVAEREPTLPPPLPPTPAPRAPSRLAGSFWAVARADGDDRSVPGAQLGGSQAGVRLSYALGAARRVALAGRVSTPLAGRGREAAVGVEWRPLDAPVRVVAEQRWSLDRGRGGPTLMAVAGLPPTALGPLVAEAYAQGGAIARGRVDGFVDGAARVSAPLRRGAWRLDLGVGVWGGAQPGAARVDLGPSLGVGLPVGERRLRVTIDWRQRVAGRARPGSGPALSIGSDF